MSFPLSLPANAPLLTVSNPKPSLWVIELHHGQDNRLNALFIDRAIRPALDAVEKHWREGYRAAQGTKDKKAAAGALIFVGKRDQDKFFSNGLDYENTSKDTNFFPSTFNPLLTRLLTFPIPTIAAINGHGFAAAFMISLACDYRVMVDGVKRNAWLCMNEVHFGAPWPTSFAATLRAKVADTNLQRKIALEGHRFTPKEALEAGLVDHIVPGGTAGVLAKAEEVAQTVAPLAVTGVWGLIKADLYRPSLEEIQKDYRRIMPDVDDSAARARL